MPTKVRPKSPNSRAVARGCEADIRFWGGEACVSRVQLPVCSLRRQPASWMMATCCHDPKRDRAPRERIHVDQIDNTARFMAAFNAIENHFKFRLNDEVSGFGKLAGRYADKFGVLPADARALRVFAEL